MVSPEDNQENPARVRSVHAALEHAVVASDEATERSALAGENYRLSPVFDVTTQQDSAYLYVENNSSDYFILNEDTISIVGGNANTFVYHNADVDVSTFTQQDFVNTRTGQADSQNQLAYFGYDNGVTINDKGLTYERDFVVATTSSQGNTSSTSGESGAVGFIIDPGDNAMLEVQNDSSETLTVSVSAEFYELRTDLPSSTQ